MATPFPFVSGAVLTAANLNAITELVTNTQTNDYTLAATDAGDRVIANKATAIVFTVPNSVFSASQIVRVHNIGAGTLTLSAGAGMTLNGADVLTLSQYQGGELFFTSASSAIFFPTAKTVAEGGLTLVSSTTIGTTVASVTVTSAFSADYDNYLITISGGVASTTNFGDMTFGATATGYYMSSNFMAFNSNTVSGISRANQTRFVGCFGATTATIDGTIYVMSPFLAKNTIIHTHFAQATAAGENSTFRGFLDDTTSYTAFTFTATTGTWTGGKVRVYGLRN